MRLILVSAIMGILLMSGCASNTYNIYSDPLSQSILNSSSRANKNVFATQKNFSQPTTKGNVTNVYVDKVIVVEKRPVLREYVTYEHAYYMRPMGCGWYGGHAYVPMTRYGYADEYYDNRPRWSFEFGKCRGRNFYDIFIGN